MVGRLNEFQRLPCLLKAVPFRLALAQRLEDRIALRIFVDESRRLHGTPRSFCVGDPVDVPDSFPFDATDCFA
jgi:hypothetical protein